jgi:ribosome biogenesis GTP-binding protein YsxC/EngB
MENGINRTTMRAMSNAKRKPQTNQISKRQRLKSISVPKKLQERIHSLGLTQDTFATSPSLSRGVILRNGPEKGTKIPIVVTQEKQVVRTPARLTLATTACQSTEFINPVPGASVDNLSPEVAFVGRSNVGKSALINALAQRSLAKASNHPGVTRTINWYSMDKVLAKNDDRVAYLIDMPGYGYAHTTQATREHWKRLLNDFFMSRSDAGQLKQLYVILDARHGLKAIDLEWLETFKPRSIPIQLIFTKCDLTTSEILGKLFVDTRNVIQQHPYLSKVVSEQSMLLSSMTRAGIADLRKHMFEKLGAPKRIIQIANRDVDVNQLDQMTQRRLKQHETKVKRIEKQRGKSREDWRRDARSLRRAVVSIVGSTQPLTDRRREFRQVKAARNLRIERNLQRSKLQSAARKRQF